MQDRAQPRKEISHLSSSLLEQKIDLREIFYALWSEKWLILSAVLIMLLLGIFYAMGKVSQYQANVLLQVNSKQNAGILSSPVSMGGISGAADATDIQITLIKSRFVLAPMVEALGLDVSVQPKYFPLFGAWFARHHSAHLQSPLFGLNRYAWGGESLQVEQMHVPLNDQNMQFKLVVGENKTYSLFMPNGQFVLQGKVGQLVETKKSDTAYFAIRVKSLEANPGTEFQVFKQHTNAIADGIASQLKIVDLGLIEHLGKTGVLQMSLSGPNPQHIVDLLNAIAEIAVKKDMERKTSESAKTLAFLNAQLPVVRRGLGQAENELNLYRQKKGTIDLTLKSRMILNELTATQRDLERVNLERITLLQKFTPLHPYIISLNEKKAALETELASLEQQLQTLPASDQNTVNLMRDVKLKSQLYLILLNKLQELQVMRAGTVSDVRILSLASLPASQLSSGRGFILMASMLFGLILGSAIVLIRKSFHQRIEDPNWLEQHFGIPTFAIVPHSKKQDENVRLYKEKSQNYLNVLASTAPRDLSIEALRSLRTSLQFALIGAKNNIITIMGISPGVGKSFVSTNFSYVLAETGKRVLLIDGDIRKGYLQDYFKTARVPGLSEVISGEVTLLEAIHKTHHRQLDFMSSGQFPPNPSELLQSDQFKNILDAVSTQYDLVLIDTAPILAVTDGVIIGNLAGVNFLLVGAGKHHAEEINMAVKRIQSHGVAMQGVIFNNSEARKNAYAHGRYNYSYAYGEAET